jgi:hypothetical protein
MSKAVLGELLKSIEDITVNNTNSTINNELLAIKKSYESRKFSSEYKFDISVETLKKEFKNILSTPLLNIPISDNIYTSLAQQYRNAIINYTKGKVGINIDNSTLCVNLNNYYKVYGIFNSALSSLNPNFTTLKNFIVETILVNSEEHNPNEREFLVAKLEPVKQFKVNYLDESNTIINAIGATVYNRLIEVSENNDYKDLELKLIALSNRSDFLATICKELKSQESEKIFKGLISSTVSFIRGISGSNVSGSLRFNVNLDQKDVASLSKSVANSVLYGYNSSLLERSLIDIITSSVEKDANNLIKSHINGWVSNTKTIPGIPTLYEMSGSPSIKKLVEERVTENLKPGKAKSKTVSSSATSKKQKLPLKSTKSSSAKIPAKPDKKQVPIWQPRTSRGQWIALSNVINLINLLLHDQIKQNMGSPRLNYRTGRFAHSAKVLSMTRDRDEYIRVQYTYMLYPYQTFEPGYAQGSRYRDPRVVISQSIRELAENFILGKLRVVRV